MAKSRAERKAAQAELAAAQQRAAEFDAAPPRFDTEDEANAALASVAKIVNMQERKNKEAKMVAKKDKKATTIPILMALPKLPKGPAKPRPTKPCACGCETPTGRTWAPGHDSNFRAWVLRVERGLLKLSEIPHEGLRKAVTADVKRRAQTDGKSKASGE